jgi:hypothetical protein
MLASLQLKLLAAILAALSSMLGVALYFENQHRAQRSAQQTYEAEKARYAAQEKPITGNLHWKGK